MVFLEDNNSFLNEVTRMFERTKSKGSVFISMKRCDIPEEERKKAKSDHRCLVRITDGKKRKYSTYVSSKDHVRFQMQFSNILKVHADALKKRERKPKTKKSTD